MVPRPLLGHMHASANACVSTTTRPCARVTRLMQSPSYSETGRFRSPTPGTGWTWLTDQCPWQRGKAPGNASLRSQLQGRTGLRQLPIWAPADVTHRGALSSWVRQGRVSARSSAWLLSADNWVFLEKEKKIACNRCRDWNFPENKLKRMEETVLAQTLTALVPVAPGSPGRGGPCTLCTCFSCGRVGSPGAESPPDALRIQPVSPTIRSGACSWPRADLTMGNPGCSELYSLCR